MQSDSLPQQHQHPAPYLMIQAVPPFYPSASSLTSQPQSQQQPIPLHMIDPSLLQQHMPTDGYPAYQVSPSAQPLQPQPHQLHLGLVSPPKKKRRSPSLFIPPEFDSWLHEHYIINAEDSVSKDSIYRRYCLWCRDHELSPKKSNIFGKMLKKIFPNIRPRRLGSVGSMVAHYAGIALRVPVSCSEEAELEAGLGQDSYPTTPDTFSSGSSSNPSSPRSAAASPGSTGGESSSPSSIDCSPACSPSVGNFIAAPMCAPSTSAVGPSLANSGPWNTSGQFPPGTFAHPIAMSFTDGKTGPYAPLNGQPVYYMMPHPQQHGQSHFAYYQPYMPTSQPTPYFFQPNLDVPQPQPQPQLQPQQQFHPCIEQPVTPQFTFQTFFEELRQEEELTTTTHTIPLTIGDIEASMKIVGDQSQAHTLSGKPQIVVTDESSSSSTSAPIKCEFFGSPKFSTSPPLSATFLQFNNDDIAKFFSTSNSSSTKNSFSISTTSLLHNHNHHLTTTTQTTQSTSMNPPLHPAPLSPSDFDFFASHEHYPHFKSEPVLLSSTTTMSTSYDDGGDHHANGDGDDEYDGCSAERFPQLSLGGFLPVPGHPFASEMHALQMYQQPGCI
eukprot:TRINITY_DN6798_c0_g1_i2.p1 TRINITY_DN6798_c0_g1~~TRINITY_DN6798_c0_g1_i2.p1  ORF type:complete len:609 (-),score=94.28 TRINITY_DN6798_c0_g1_i2:260-2086(-)